MQRSALEEASGRPLQPPGASYDPEWHIARDREQTTACRFLESPGTPAVLWGPERFGKTWLLEHLLERLLRDNDGQTLIVSLDLASFDPASWSSIDKFLHGFAAGLVAHLDLSGSVLSTAWRRPSHPVQKLNWLTGRHILPAAGERLILVIDNSDAVCAAPFQDDFFGLLRAWVEQSSAEPWSRLRLLMTLSTSPALLRTTTASSPFNLVPSIKLDDFDRTQVQSLAALHGLGWSDEETEDVVSLVGGHPYLVRLAMYQAALHRKHPAELLTADDPDGGIFAPHLHECLSRLREERPLLEAIGRVLADPTTHLSSETYRCLNSMGLVVQDANEYRLRYPLYAQFLRTRR